MATSPYSASPVPAPRQQTSFLICLIVPPPSFGSSIVQAGTPAIVPEASISSNRLSNDACCGLDRFCSQKPTRWVDMPSCCASSDCWIFFIIRYCFIRTPRLVSGTTGRPRKAVIRGRCQVFGCTLLNSHELIVAWLTPNCVATSLINRPRSSRRLRSCSPIVVGLATYLVFTGLGTEAVSREQGNESNLVRLIGRIRHL